MSVKREERFRAIFEAAEDSIFIKGCTLQDPLFGGFSY